MSKTLRKDDSQKVNKKQKVEVSSESEVYNLCVKLVKKKIFDLKIE